MDLLEPIAMDKAAEQQLTTSVPELAIRVRAYELYERRGRQDGLALQDWLQAEMELREPA